MTKEEICLKLTLQALENKAVGHKATTHYDEDGYTEYNANQIAKFYNVLYEQLSSKEISDSE